MDPLSPVTVELFKKNRLAGHFNYVRPGEVVPHFFSRGSYFLSRDETTKQLIGTVNSCLHRGFKLVNQRMKLKPDQHIGCKFHNWTYDQGGTLLTTPGFDREVNGCLKKVELSPIGESLFFETDSLRWAGSFDRLFSPLKYVQGADARSVVLAKDGLRFLSGPDLGNYSFDQESVTFYPCNWKTFMEVYLDAYHHQSAHPNGIGKFLNDEMVWYSDNEFVVNIIGIAPEGTSISSFGWSKFNEELRKIGWIESWGAVFCTIFPGCMIEFFPHTMVISQLVPISDKMTANYLQIYYDSTVRENYDFQNAFGDAYSETATGDGALQELLEDGRGPGWYDQSMMPAHSNLEAGLSYFNEWLCKNS